MTKLPNYLTWCKKWEKTDEPVLRSWAANSANVLKGIRKNKELFEHTKKSLETNIFKHMSTTYPDYGNFEAYYKENRLSKSTIFVIWKFHFTKQMGNTLRLVSSKLVIVINERNALFWFCKVLTFLHTLIPFYNRCENFNSLTFPINFL